MNKNLGKDNTEFLIYLEKLCQYRICRFPVRGDTHMTSTLRRGGEEGKNEMLSEVGSGG